jgi:hypothetical protein
LKSETLEYLKGDLVCLYQVLDKFGKHVFKDFDIQITNSLTISSLALNTYLQNFYENPCLPLINNKNLYNDIVQSYFGGVTEVYRPYGQNLYYYDVNSLYPFAALNPMPSAFNTSHWINVDNSDTIKLKDIFGFCFCEIETSENYLGFLPIRSKEGMILPQGN